MIIFWKLNIFVIIKKEFSHTNFYLKLFQMSSQPSLVTELCDVTIVSVSAGSYHSAAVDQTGKLWTWGWGVHGQLGLGEIEDEFLPRRVLDREMSLEAVVKVEAGYAHTVALTGNSDEFLFLNQSCHLKVKIKINSNICRPNTFKKTLLGIKF